MNLAKMFAEWRQRVIAQRASNEETVIKSKIDKIETTDLLTLKWIWDWTVKLLLENGISSLEELTKEKIKKIEWLNPLSLKSINEYLKTK